MSPSSPAVTGRFAGTTHWLTPLAIAAVLLLHAWLAISATRNESTTVDEMAHLTAGHAIWARGDYRLQPENGVLPQLWEGLPAALEHFQLPPRSSPGWSKPNVWTLGNVYFHEIGNDLGALLWDGRLMNVCWSLGCGVLVFAWSRRLFGSGGAWVSFLLWAFSPNFLAHGALATSDMCMTFFMIASVGAYWRHLQRPDWKTLLASAVTLGLAFVAKYSAVLLPIMLATLAVVRLRGAVPFTWRGRAVSTRHGRIGLLLASAAAHLLVVVAVIWAFYAFRFEPNTDPTLVNDYTRPWATVLASLGGMRAFVLQWTRAHHLLPDAYLYGFGFVVDLAQSRGAFLNGQTSTAGWVRFFPYAFFAKTTLAVLAALVGVIAVTIRRWTMPSLSAADGQAAVGRRATIVRIRRDLYRTAPLLVLLVVYWLVSLTTRLNIGHRHLLPTYPVLFIAAGALGWAAVQWRRGWRWLAAAVLAGQIYANATIRPHYLAYFNELAGGPSEGYRHLVDSSLDWGQDLPGLAEWLRARGLPNATTPVYLAYFGTGDPEYYGIRAIPMVPLLRTMPDQPWYQLQPGVYCISATLLQQAYSPVRGPWTPALEKEYQDLRSIAPALVDYYQHPERRREWDKATSPAKWKQMWQQYEQLRFTRLCAVLRARRPDAQIGYSINIYFVTASDLAAAERPLNVETRPGNSLSTR